MKYNLLTIMLSISVILSFGQKKEANKNYKKGNSFFEAKDYKSAIEYYTKSIDLLPAADAYYNRALCNFHLSDTCKFCYDLMMAYDFGDFKASKLYYKKCRFSYIIKDIPDYIKEKIPECLWIEISKERCKIDSTVFAYSIFESDTNTCIVTKGADDPVFTKLKGLPKFPGGEEGLNRFLIANLVYPVEATEKGIKGTVYISFIIEKDGSVSHITLLRGIGGGCDEESLRVINLMPKWKPGTRKGKPVRVLFNMPVYFNLRY